MIFREIFNSDKKTWVYRIIRGGPGSSDNALIGEGKCASEEAAFVQSRGILREYQRLGDDVGELSDPYLDRETTRVIERKSIYHWTYELNNAQRTLEGFKKEKAHPETIDSWTNHVNYLKRRIEEAKTEATTITINQKYQKMSLKSLVWLVMDIGEQHGDGLMAERELIRRVQARPPSETLEGPARIIYLDDEEGLSFTSIAPSETFIGQFEAYDVGFWD
ncbi:MAG: hypothetical protein BroJett011_62120 [Chloroflexota bacterium]|nr:MAG: hypothetical protein BroJett011_62120 [Chloroflexota bacterium]